MASLPGPFAAPSRMLSTKHKIALARLAQTGVMAQRRLFGGGPETTVTRRGLVWRLDLREGIDFSIWLRGAFEPETVKVYAEIVRAGDVALDIGANIGAHTLPLARLVGPSGRVIAFEPTRYAFGKLTGNLALNPDLQDHVTPRQAMLVAEKDAALPDALYSSWPLAADGETHALHLGQRKSTEGAVASSLDHLIAHEALQRLDLIKLDIDGFECQMLRGARATLARFKPVIVMELAPYVLREQGASAAELVAILSGYGYRLTRFDGAPVDTAVDLDQAIPAGTSVNVLARAQ